MIVSTTALGQEIIASTPRHPKLAQFIREKSLRHGQFRLASGESSDYYLDGKVTSCAPEGIDLIVKAILAEIQGLNFDAVGGMDMGATPIVGALALRSHQLNRPIPTFIVRKETKAHGTMKQVEGLLPVRPSDVVIVDDVVTTGGSILKAINVVRSAGHEVILAISVVDRDEGGRELLHEQGIRYQPLVSISELGIGDGSNRASGQSSTV